MNPTAKLPSVSDSEHVRDVVSRLFRAVEDLDAEAYFDGIYHPEVVIHEDPSLPYGGDYHGLDGAFDHAKEFLSAWGPHRLPGEENMQATIDAMTDNAYVHWTLSVSGTEFLFLSHYRFENGLIIESRMFPVDSAEVASRWQQLDAELRASTRLA